MVINLKGHEFKWELGVTGGAGGKRSNDRNILYIKEIFKKKKACFSNTAFSSSQIPQGL